MYCKIPEKEERFVAGLAALLNFEIENESKGLIRNDPASPINARYLPRRRECSYLQTGILGRLIRLIMMLRLSEILRRCVQTA